MASIAVNMDKTVPTILNINYTPRVYEIDLTFTGGDGGYSGLNEYKFYKNDVLDGTNTLKNNVYKNLTNIVGENNEYKLKVEASTIAGKFDTKEIIAALAPKLTCSINIPTYNAGIETLNTSLNCSDNNRVKDVTFTVKVKETGALAQLVGTNTFNVIGAQTYIISASAIDDLGGELIITSIEYSTDGVPVPVLIAPADATSATNYWYTSVQTYNVDKNANGWGPNIITEYQVKLNGEEWPTNWTEANTFTLPMTPAKGGIYDIRIQNRNTVTGQTIAGTGQNGIKIDTISPIINGGSSLADDNKTVIIYLTTIVGISGKSDITVTASDGASESDITQKNGDLTWIATKNGTYTFLFTNGAGKVTEKIISITEIVTTTSLANFVKQLGSNNGVYNEPSSGINYRYQGKNVNNYVSFNNETWRIIGVFDSTTHGQSEELVKIMKDSFEEKMWHSSNINNWSQSELKTYLNSTYYNNLNATARNMIQSVTWKLGGFTNKSIGALNAYNAERGIGGYIKYGSNTTEISANIGLMYPSDYGYSSPGTTCNREDALKSENYSDCWAKSWIYNSAKPQWTITHNSDNANQVWFVNTIQGYMVMLYGGVDSNTPNTSSRFISPVLYLKSTVLKTGGEGTIVNPYTIE